MPVQRTESELLFDQYLTEHDYDFDPQPEVPGKTSQLDDRVRFDGETIFFEVKEFETGKALAGGAFDPYKRIYSKLKDSRKQLNEYKEYPCALVLYTDGNAPVYLEPEFVLGAMLGTLTWRIDMRSGVRDQFFGASKGFRTGHMVDFEHGKSRSTQFSAIVVLELFPLGRIKLSPLLDERKKHRAANFSGVQNAVDTHQYIERLKSEGFDIDETKLRVVVYENPFAARRLAPAMFQGPYDERWGRNAPGKIESLVIILLRFIDGWLSGRLMTGLIWLFLRSSKSAKITKVYEGPKLMELEPALRSYHRPALVEAGLLKEK
jgi:hypothetical protein